MHQLYQAHKKEKPNDHLMITETSTYNQVNYCHGNSKSQLVPVKREKQCLHGAIYQPISFVMMPCYQANLKVLRYETISLKRILTTSVLLICWLGQPLQKEEKNENQLAVYYKIHIFPLQKLGQGRLNYIF